MIPKIDFNIITMDNVKVLCNGVEYGHMFRGQMTGAWTFTSKFDGMTFTCDYDLTKSCNKVRRYIKQDFDSFMS